MITHKAIVRRFKAGESVEQLADYISRHTPPGSCGRYEWDFKLYVEHALRQVMKRQGGA